jgi:predicted O-methyltransferase YrrM
MNSVLEEILKTGSTHTADGHPVRLSSAISSDEGKFLQDLVSELNPTATLEIGLAHGVSALFICEALKQGGRSGLKHIVIDPNQFAGNWGTSWQGIGLNNLQKAGFGDMVEFHNLPSYQSLAKLEAEGCKIDFAFVDGWHTFDYTLVDFFFIDKLLKVGGIVAFDDADWPSVQKVCRYLASNRSYTVHKCLRKRLPQLSLSKTSVVRFLKVLYQRRAYLCSDYVKYGLLSTSSCIAFKKTSEDIRRWDAHHNF